MGCGDAKRSTPLFTGDWVGPVTMGTDRMNVAYYGAIDPFSPSFIINRQLAVWHCVGFLEDCGTYYDWDWLNSYATFGPGDWNSGTDAGPHAANSGTPITCLQRVAPGQSCLEGGTNNDIWSKVCGYVVNSAYGNCTASSNAWGFGWSNASFGCVHEPLKPGPPPFNKVYLGENSPSVVALSMDEMINRGSTFGYPAIIITSGQTASLNQQNLTITGTPTGTELTLTYDFNATAQTCQSFPAADKMPGTFCADVSDDNPSQVCFCKQGNCSLDAQPYIMGCVDRPTPKQSNLKMVAFYARASDGSPSVTVRYLSSNPNGDLCLGSSSSPTSFCDQGAQTIIRHTPDPNYNAPTIPTPFLDPTYKHTYSQNIKAYTQAQMLTLGGLPYNSIGYFREYYYDSTKPQFPFSKEGITVSSVSSALGNLFRKAYRLSFEPVIPAVTNPIVVIKNPINDQLPPQTTCTIPKLMQSNTYLTSDLFNTVVPYKRYSLERDRHLTQDSAGTVTDPCNQMYGNYYGSICNPRALPEANDVVDSYTVNRAFCPGVFVNTDIQHQICFTPVSNSWAALTSELATNYHDLCVPIPIVPNKTDPTPAQGCPSEKPAASNYYVAWPVMGYGATLAGTCDTNSDLENRSTYSVTPMMTQTNYCNALCGTNSGCLQTCATTNYTAYVNKFNTANNALTARAELALGQSRNLFTIEVQLIQALFDQTKIGNNSLHTVTSTSAAPSKKCNNDGSVTRTGGCVYKAGCNATSTSSRFLGNMTWTTPTINVSTGTPKTRLAAMTADNLGLRGLAFPQTSTTCVVNPVPPATSSTTATVATTTRWCNAFFDGANVLQGKAWIDVDLSMPGAISCIAKNPT